ncbi:MAG: glucose 1-dehydrogenase [Caldilineae bacterium]|nr:MAG: glucose 1-dehydrogenase [Caldilineae bacterium]
MSEERLDGKRALVTGVDVGNIGQGIALELARQGASVVCHFPFDGRGADETVAQITAAGGWAAAVQGDFSQDVETCHRVVDAAAGFLGGLDVLVNNAGVTEQVPLLEVTPDHFARLIRINLRSQLFCSQQAVRWMEQAGGGAIINITSVHAFSGLAGFGVYAATKGAIVSLTRQMAIELAPMHIRVNAVAPGAVEVPRYRADPAYRPETYAAQVPWGRLGAPKDIGQAVAFLASDAADFITGQVLTVDGGTDARMAFQL